MVGAAEEGKVLIEVLLHRLVSQGQTHNLIMTEGIETLEDN
jgi:hypothetical protein